MIYILTGNDTKKKNAYVKKLCKDDLPVFVPQSDISKDKFFEYAGSVSLFGLSSFIVCENIIKDKIVDFSLDDLSILKSSDTTFIFLEDKLLAPDLKKYKKYATIEDFSASVVKQVPKVNTFNIAEAFSRRDKIGTWILYREAVARGTAPEEVSGIIFWKIKTMLLSGTKFFSKEELKDRSSELIDIYHRAHRGEIDFTIGLEQFILSSLSK